MGKRTQKWKLLQCYISLYLDSNIVVHWVLRENLVRLMRQHEIMARLVLGVEMRTPTIEVLDRLHWVSIEERWIFNKCNMVFHALSDQAPTYLSSLFIKLHSVHTHSTRNADNKGLILPKMKTQMGKNSFSHSGRVM